MICSNSLLLTKMYCELNLVIIVLFRISIKRIFPVLEWGKKINGKEILLRVKSGIISCRCIVLYISLSWTRLIIWFGHNLQQKDQKLQWMQKTNIYFELSHFLTMVLLSVDINSVFLIMYNLLGGYPINVLKCMDWKNMWKN
jgi:hypothetical protein